MNRILVIDDNREFAEGLCLQLKSRGYAVQSAGSGQVGLALAAENPPRLVLLDLRLSDMSGIEVLTRLKASLPGVDVVIMTAHPEFSSARAAIKGNVLDYLTKPFAFDELDEVLGGVFHAEPRGPARRQRAPDRSPRGTDMIGASPAIKEVRDLIRQFATSGVRMALITGESGTGKELAARLFHAEGARRDGPFVEVNCSAVSETLFESEFFGHERGAFTGAVGSRRGLVELADGGTLFLDEVGEIPLSCQPKLLRFLDDQGFLRVGGSRKIRVDVQIVAATNRNLGEMVAQRTFRMDLFFRLDVASIALPPLRERPEDILALARYWLEDANARYGKRIAGFTADAEALLCSHSWPGNVRELRNLVERLAIRCAGDRIAHTQFPAEWLSSPPPPATDATPGLASLEKLEQAHIRNVLARMDGNKTRAAEILGISRQTLRSKLAQVG